MRWELKEFVNIISNTEYILAPCCDNERMTSKSQGKNPTFFLKKNYVTYCCLSQYFNASFFWKPKQRHRKKYKKNERKEAMKNKPKS